MFVPGSRRDFLQHVLVEQRYQPDWIIVDFEDALRDPCDPDNESSLKISARHTVQSFFPLAPAVAARYCLRIHDVHHPDFAADLAFLSATRHQLPVAIVVPKVTQPGDIVTVERALSVLESRPSTAILPLIESPAGMAALDQIVMASPRVRGFCFGHIDYFFDLGQFPIPLHLFASEMLYQLLTQCLAVARRCRKEFIDGGFYYADRAPLLQAHCAVLAALGAGEVTLGKLVMHPRQIPIIHGCRLTPPPSNPYAAHPKDAPLAPAAVTALARQIVTTYEGRADRTSSVCRTEDLIIAPQMYLLAKRWLHGTAGT